MGAAAGQGVLFFAPVPHEQELAVSDDHRRSSFTHGIVFSFRKIKNRNFNPFLIFDWRLQI